MTEGRSSLRMTEGRSSLRMTGKVTEIATSFSGRTRNDIEH